VRAFSLTLGGLPLRLSDSFCKMELVVDFASVLKVVDREGFESPLKPSRVEVLPVVASFRRASAGCEVARGGFAASEEPNVAVAAGVVPFCANVNDPPAVAAFGLADPNDPNEPPKGLEGLVVGRVLLAALLLKALACTASSLCWMLLAVCVVSSNFCWMFAAVFTV